MVWLKQAGKKPKGEPLPKGWCNLCGCYKNLNYEHVPPQAAFNSYKFVKVTADEYWNGIHKGEKIPILPCQGGHGIYSLCEDCNNRTGRAYGKSFIDWSRQGYTNYNGLVGDGAVCFFDDIRPLRILKQMACMFVAMNMNHRRFRHHNSPLVDFVYNTESRWLPSRYRFWVYFVGPGPLRITNFGSVMDITGAKSMSTGIEIAYPPFGYMLTFDSVPHDERLTEITGFRRYGYHDRDSIMLYLNVLHTHGPMMGDFRCFARLPERKLDDVRYIIKFGKRDEDGELQF